DPDAGIWEMREEPAHHVHSKVMGWLALDRAVRMASSRRTRGARVAAWTAERDSLAPEIWSRGFDGERSSLTRSYGSRELDAAILVLPSVGIEPAGSPRVASTVDSVVRELSAGGPLLYRYPPGSDGLA